MFWSSDQQSKTNTGAVFDPANPPKGLPEDVLAKCLPDSAPPPENQREPLNPQEPVHCPHCDTRQTIPLKKVLRLKQPMPAVAAPSERHNGQRCPACGNAVAPTSIICVSCGYDHRTGSRHVTLLSDTPGINARRPLPPNPHGKPIASPGLVLLVIFCILVPSIKYGWSWRNSVRDRNAAFAEAMRQEPSDATVTALMQFVDKYPCGDQGLAAQARLAVVATQVVATAYATAYKQAERASGPLDVLRILEGVVAKYPDAAEAAAAKKTITNAKEEARQNDALAKAIAAASGSHTRNALLDAKACLEAAALANPLAGDIPKVKDLLLEIDNRLKVIEKTTSDAESSRLIECAKETDPSAYS